MNNDKFKFYKRIEKIKWFASSLSYYRLKYRSRANKLTLSYLFIDRNIYRHTGKNLYMKRSFKLFKYYKDFSDDFKSFTDYIKFTSDPKYNEFFGEYYPNIKMSFYATLGR